jgi:phosphopantothenoylcysteine decarboxylase / phosphopantothenate---cysteine ligase
MIVVGVCGGIAAYKTCELVRILVRGGHDVQVIQTPAATRFIGPTTFAALSRRPVLTDDGAELFPHLEASREADLMVIAPLTATTLSRIAHGDAATVLTASALAFAGPIVAAPAMNPRMWAAEPTRASVRELLGRGVEIVGPETGDTAEGELGEGRMAEPERIFATVQRRLQSARSMAGMSVLVTAGGTREPLDAVRYLGNRSSGKMGVAVAEEAVRRGADVTLVMAAATARPSAPMRVLEVETAAELAALTLQEAGGADVVVMAAAVADYRPVTPASGKRTKGGERWHIELEPTTDILVRLGETRSSGQRLIGFAAEHGGEAVERARGKLVRKRVDMIVVNDISRSDIGFDQDANEITIVTSDGEKTVSRRSKQECAAAIWDAAGMLAGTPAATVR